MHFSSDSTIDYNLHEQNQLERRGENINSVNRIFCTPKRNDLGCLVWLSLFSGQKHEDSRKK